MWVIYEVVAEAVESTLLTVNTRPRASSSLIRRSSGSGSERTFRLTVLWFSWQSRAVGLPAALSLSHRWAQGSARALGEWGLFSTQFTCFHVISSSSPPPSPGVLELTFSGFFFVFVYTMRSEK